MSHEHVLVRRRAASRIGTNPGASGRRAGEFVRLSVRPTGPGSRQRKHRQLAAERSVVAQASVAADGAQAGGRIRQTRRKADTGPAADARKDRDVLLAVILIGRDVADDARRSLELVELLAGLGVD